MYIKHNAHNEDITWICRSYIKSYKCKITTSYIFYSQNNWPGWKNVKPPGCLTLLDYKKSYALIISQLPFSCSIKHQEEEKHEIRSFNSSFIVIKIFMSIMSIKQHYYSLYWNLLSNYCFYCWINLPTNTANIYICFCLT